MSNSSAWTAIKDSILDGSIFNENNDVVELAHQSGFVIYNVEMADDDGFIIVDENEKIKKFDSNKVIGVNASNELKDKIAFIAQELLLYYTLKQKDTRGKLNFVQIDRIDPRNAEFMRSALLSMENAMEIKLNKGNIKEQRSSDIVPEEILDIFINNINQKTLIAAQRGIKPKAQAAALKKIKEMTSKEAKTLRALEERWVTSKAQRERDEHVEDLLGDYVLLNKVREMQRIQNRKALFVFCIVTASVIIAISLVLLIIWVPIVAGQHPPMPAVTFTPTPTPALNELQNGGVSLKNNAEVFSVEGLFVDVAMADEGGSAGTEETEITPTPVVSASPGEVNEVENYINIALASNASTTAKDIVALISICITILGSIFGLLRMIAKYVLPEKEEETMHAFVKTVQENDFKDKIVHRLYEVKEYDKIITFLALPNKPAAQESQQGQNKQKETALDKIQKTLDELKDLIKKLIPTQ